MSKEKVLLRHVPTVLLSVCPRGSERVRETRACLDLGDSNHGAILIAGAKLEALRNFLLRLPPDSQSDHRNLPDYPLEAVNMLDIVADIETDAWNAALEEYMHARLSVGSSTARQFTDSVEQLRDQAVEWYKTGNAAVKKCLDGLMDETHDMLEEIAGMAKDETELITGLDAMYAEVMRLQKKYCGRAEGGVATY
jgi:hypothetical protein